jgi:hypothetical protein
MHPMLLKMVIRNAVGSSYLTRSKKWTSDKADAWEYTTDLVFIHAVDHGGLVYLRLPMGREVEVYNGDFL